jgi:16S rRNA G966 N2-methylase RsmD
MSGEIELKLGRAQDVLPGTERRFDALFFDPPRAQPHGRANADHVDLAEFVNICDAVWDLLKPNAWVAIWSRPEDRVDLEAEARRMELHRQGEVVWNNPGLLATRTRGVDYKHQYVLLYSLERTPTEAQYPLISVWTEPLQFLMQKHPQAKPMYMTEKVLEWITPEDGAQVLDPCAGEGTLMCAAIRSGRGYLGAEVASEWATAAMTASLRARKKRETEKVGRR